MANLMFKVVTVEEARMALKSHISQISRKVENVPLESACFRYVARDITAAENVPGFSRSTMDGFAVNAADTFGASSAQPAYLNVIGEIKMGEEASQKINSGETLQIPTGGMLPPGADAVVMLEDTEWLDKETVGVLRAVAPGENVVRKGEDIAAGEVVLKANSRLRPQDLGGLAAAGINEVPVWEKLSVGIISTGNEIIPPQEKLTPGKIRDINSFTLAGLVQELGASPKLYGIVQDDFCELQKRVETALQENHIILLSGGSSVGTRDHTLSVLEQLEGFEILFHGISVKPGKPALTAVGKDKIVFGLPGHPVSAMVAFQILVEPLLSWNFNHKNCNFVKARITRSLSSTPGREDHIRVKLNFKDNILYAEPILGKSALINTMLKSDGEIIIPMGEEGIGAGEEVTVFL